MKRSQGSLRSFGKGSLLVALIVATFNFFLATPGAWAHRSTASLSGTYLLSYTCSKNMSVGCDGWYGVEGLLHAEADTILRSITASPDSTSRTSCPLAGCTRFSWVRAGSSALIAQDCDLVQGISPFKANKEPSQCLNPAAFVNPAPYTFGNTGRNAFRSDGPRNFDLSFFRVFPITESRRPEIPFRVLQRF